ncbi:hypothetical protein L6452_39391 [Arctium lappa]|uniref:Uncharacterized protein n=1 Tax=Arctium lappa TaxID=4217 RepID=A0ACB8XSD9_ARCLA|nr:hypothetical protein L6452_39391 [Arctium lappa]
MFAAIEDGVDVITIAFGCQGHVAFHYDVVTSVSVLAIYKGITVVCAAGNFGPSRSTHKNEAPWVLTFGAAIKPNGIVTPTMASFSSRRPNSISPGILKTYIIGSGVHIFGASNMETKATFVTNSGASMACPHLSGITTLLKSAHPDLSPTAIKSAIMMTADPVKDERCVNADVFAVGAGHVNALKAVVDLGYVFDIQPDDYIPYLLGLGYTTYQVEKMVRKEPSSSKRIAEAELNLPSIAIAFRPGEKKKYMRNVIVP